MKQYKILILHYYGYYDSDFPSKDEVEFSKEEYQKWKNGINPIVDIDGNTYYLDENRFWHREGNLPAFIRDEGSVISYYHHGKPHRTNGYAFEYSGKHGIPKNNHPFYYYFGKRYETKEEFEKGTMKRIYFLREKIICLKNLTEIPEQFDKIYYQNKNTFLSLLKKI